MAASVEEPILSGQLNGLSINEDQLKQDCVILNHDQVNGLKLNEDLSPKIETCDNNGSTKVTSSSTTSDDSQLSTPTSGKGLKFFSKIDLRFDSCFYSN
jgi:hypothetical protein